MIKSKKVTCVVTGKTSNFAGEYLEKLLKEYSNEETLDAQYVCKEVKALLKKGYKIVDIRKILNINEEEDMPTKSVISILENEYKKTAVKVNDEASPGIANLTTFTYNKSDDDVEIFMNKFIIKP